MKIDIVGKEHTEGVAKKTGKPYSLNIIYYTATKTGVNGKVAERAALSADDFGFETIQVGKPYNLEYDSRGFVADFYPA